MNKGHLVIAYHGCDQKTRDDLVLGKTPALDHSKNRYDWLGRGAYFFEEDLHRAKHFAETAAKQPNKKYSARLITTPAVVGVVLEIQRCLDMTTQKGIGEFWLGFKGLEEACLSNNKPVP